jgi:hypothetical protein
VKKGLLDLWSSDHAYKSNAGTEPIQSILLQVKFLRKQTRNFSLLHYYINQGVVSNVYAKNDFLKGQVVGRLFGGNSTTTSDSLTSTYFEQRLIPFLIYQPNCSTEKQL